jgi:hypothetical protein
VWRRWLRQHGAIQFQQLRQQFKLEWRCLEFQQLQQLQQQFKLQ